MLAQLRLVLAVEEHALLGVAQVRSVAVCEQLDGRHRNGDPHAVAVHFVRVDDPLAPDDVFVECVVGVDRALDRRLEVLAPTLAEVELVLVLPARPEPLALRIHIGPRREHTRGGYVVVALDHERRVCRRPVAHCDLLFDLVFFDCLGGPDSSASAARNSPSRSSRASHVARRSLIQRSAVLSASGSISHVRTRPTLCERTTPLASSTCRCWTTAGSDIASGRASSLTDAGPSSRQSIIARLFASESAWKTTSIGGSRDVGCLDRY